VENASPEPPPSDPGGLPLGRHTNLLRLTPLVLRGMKVFKAAERAFASLNFPITGKLRKQNRREGQVYPEMSLRNHHGRQDLPIAVAACLVARRTI
ncbi:hypothetical protein M9458_038938, partial [Cirrhinus mrigala]